MKKGKQHSKEFKERLVANEADITDYLQRKTGYIIQLKVEYDENLGYRYSAKVSLDNFKTYAKWILESTTKTNIKAELQSKILNVNWKAKKLGQSVAKDKAISKAVKSTAKTLDCVVCKEDKNVYCYHRNIHNTLFIHREGYSFICHDCLIKEFNKILQNDSSVYQGFIYLCSIYNRPIYKELIDRLQESVSTPRDLVQRYFKQLNLQQYKGKLFADTKLNWEEFLIEEKKK